MKILGQVSDFDSDDSEMKGLLVKRINADKIYSVCPEHEDGMATDWPPRVY